MVGAAAIMLTAYGSNFDTSGSLQWNGNVLPSTWVSTTEMTATIPASDFASIGSGQVTVNQGLAGGLSNAQTFTITAAPAGTTWVKTVGGITEPQDIVWDARHGNLYVSVGSGDPAIPNTIVAVNPVTGIASTPVAGGNNPDLLSISSDSSYLWAGIDGSNAVQRFLLPGLEKDVSFLLPKNPYNIPPLAASLEAAPTSAHTVAVMIGGTGVDPYPGDGVYIYDDATQRPTFVPGSWGSTGGPVIDSILWGADDETIYASGNGVATLSVNSSGVSFAGNMGGGVGPLIMGQYDASNGLLYDFDEAFNPTDGSLVGTFDLPGLYYLACTADPSLGRYYVLDAIPVGGTDVSSFELWVFDLKTYALLDRVQLGQTQGTEFSPVTGSPNKLVRWGNAGLALITYSGPYVGTGGVFLIDGAAVNPNAIPDVSSGTSLTPYMWMTSLTPQQVSTGSSPVTLTINGTNFTPYSTACVNCNYLQFQFLPTTYMSPTQLKVTIPASLAATTSSGPLPIGLFDSSSNLFSTNTLALTVGSPASGSTQVTALNLAGLAMAWDKNSQFLYVGAADYDAAYPNSIVAINGSNGAIAEAQVVGPDPDFLSISADGGYLYAAFAPTTIMSRVQLPGLGAPLTWALRNPESSAVFYPGDMKAAPVSSHTTALALVNWNSQPPDTGGVVIFDDDILRPDFASYNLGSYDTVAWGQSDELLTASEVALSIFQVTSSGVSSIAIGPTSFNNGDPMHSDFGTGLIYSDDGNVADPSTLAIVGTYNASGVVAPDSSLKSVFILGQTESQANTNNYTIDSFDEMAYTPISSITLTNLLGTPVELVRWGTSGLALLTINQNGGPAGMLYLIQDTNFITNATIAASSPLTPQESYKSGGTLIRVRV